MILLDTDHLTILRNRDSDRRRRLIARMAASGEDSIGTTIVTAEEQLRGWLACIAKEKHVERQISPYFELHRLLDFLSDFQLALFDGMASDRYQTLRNLRVGTMDLKIASIALVNDATLLTANRRDFEKVPGLKFENWLD